MKIATNDKINLHKHIELSYKLYFKYFEVNLCVYFIKGCIQNSTNFFNFLYNFNNKVATSF